jgi:hypothetical protein
MEDVVNLCQQLKDDNTEKIHRDTSKWSIWRLIKRKISERNPMIQRKQ